MYTFQMNMRGKQRPVVLLYGNEALIDTGAVIPMISLSPELIKLAWNAELLLADTKIGGIGGTSKGDVYTLHNFKVGDITFDSLDVFVPYKPDTKYMFLLSSTMFYGMNFSFDMIDKDNQSFTVRIPDEISLHRTFEIKSLEGKLYAQVDGVLIQDDSLPTVEIINYTQSLNEDYDGFDIGDD